MKKLVLGGSSQWGGSVNVQIARLYKADVGPGNPRIGPVHFMAR